uniref:Predicted protein n=1 Tax=Hordeum vulgare subsp. vulgare TaxID=112509 RepID=F2DY63_HORVV|nr:predicted protein [Hordeum vulgare subsp. vulgare]
MSRLSTHAPRRAIQQLPCGRALLLLPRRPPGGGGGGGQGGHGVGVGLGQVLVRGREPDLPFLPPAAEHAPGPLLRAQLVPLQQRPPLVPLQQPPRLAVAAAAAAAARGRQTVVQVAEPDDLAAVPKRQSQKPEPTAFKISQEDSGSGAVRTRDPRWSPATTAVWRTGEGAGTSCA